MEYAREYSVHSTRFNTCLPDVKLKVYVTSRLNAPIGKQRTLSIVFLVNYILFPVKGYARLP